MFEILYRAQRIALILYKKKQNKKTKDSSTKDSINPIKKKTKQKKQRIALLLYYLRAFGI